MTEQILDLLKDHAVSAAKYSYSPYSGFPVGAAVSTVNGRIFTGCNVENASFGLTQCAERSALTAAVAGGAEPGSCVALVIYTPGQAVHSPCGACRQVMSELMAENSTVVSCCDGTQTRSWSKQEYLPDPFTPDSLNLPSKPRP